MSGIDRITEKIISQAELEAKNRILYAKDDADKNTKSLSRRLERTIEHELKRAEVRAKEAADRLIANSRLEGRKKKLAAKQDMVDKVFDDVVEKLAGLPENEYIEFLCKLALPVLDEKENAIILSEKDKASIGKKLIKALREGSAVKNIELSEESVKTSGGLIVKIGDIQTNLTLESILRLEREKLESDVVGILFKSR